MRDKIFISHANPQDNEFSMWLALRLAGEGFPVWCDLTKLIGGEEFWDEIEDAIRNQTIKFLYVLSESSNHKEGPRKELRVASNVQKATNLKDFIIPLRIDGTPSIEFNIEIGTKTVIDFANSWAGGLRQLIHKLEQDQVARKDNFTHGAVADWWSSHANAQQGVIQEPEELLSNWFPVRIEPARLQIHTLSRPISLVPRVLKAGPYPIIALKRALVTFGERADLGTEVLDQSAVVSSESVSLDAFTSAELGSWFGGLRQRRNLLYSLFANAWERFALSKGLLAYAMVNRKIAYCFPLSAVSVERLPFRDERGQVHRRALVGARSIRQHDTSTTAKYYWHFGLEAKPLFGPIVGYAIKYHLAFSNDGLSFWEDKERSHRARRRIGKDWWNSEWRDRLLTAMNWLCQSADFGSAAIGSKTVMSISRLPQSFGSPVSYVDPGTSVVEPESLDESEDEDADDQLAEVDRNCEAKTEPTDV